jgi:hypothetical protein
MAVRITWPDPIGDFDLYVQRRAGGGYVDVRSATSSTPGRRGALDRQPARGRLTDGALRVLPEFADVPASQVGQTTVYTGQVTFRRCTEYATDDTCTSDERTLDDPLARDVNQPGSRFNSGMRRQIFEPTPLGIAIQDGSGADASSARQWDVDAQTFQAAGGRIAATSVDSGTRDAGPVLERATVGEIALGAGTVRVAGALLPQPSTEHDHPLGLEPYALTYTGYILACNLLDARCPVVGASG